MMEYIEGDIFESPAQVIVNTVNTVGVMGKGVALSFRRRYPEMFERYKAACEKGIFSIGKLMLFYEPDHWVLLFPTKEHWRNPSKLEYIEKGLEKFCRTYAEKHITSVAFPRLGCGNGALNWEDVKPLMEKYLSKLPIDVYVYLGVYPDSPPEHKEPKKTIEWLRKHAKDMSFNGLKDDLLHQGGMFAYEYQEGGLCHEMNFRNGELSISSPRERLTITEEELYAAWDRLRMKLLVDITETNDADKAICGLLHSLGYLSRIKILNKESQRMVDGYQLNQGLGRVHQFS